MATFYGAWQYRDGSYGQRLILDLSRSGDTIYWNLKLESNGSMYASVTWSWSGNITGGGSTRCDHSGAFIQTINSGSFVRRDAASTTASASMFWGGRLTVSGNIGANVVKPSPPTNLRFEQTDADRAAGRGVLHWTKGANAVNTRIVTAYDGRSWYNLGVVSGTSLSVQGMAEDNYHIFNAVSVNSSGESSVTELKSGSAHIKFFTKPLSPVDTRVYVVNSTSVTVGFTLRARFKHGVHIESSAGGSWTFGDGVSGTVSDSYILSVGTNTSIKFRVRSFNGASNARVYSDWSPWSNAVATLSAPSAPTSVAPNGGVYDNSVNSPITVSWVHNPTDGTPQSGWRIRYKDRQSSSWSSPVESSGSQSSTVLNSNIWNIVRTYSNPEIQVSTMGALAGSWSPWSATASFTLVSPPNVTLRTPNGSTYPHNKVNATWSVTSSLNQTFYEVDLIKNNTVIETKRGASDSTSVWLNTTLENNTQYTVRVRVRVSTNIWSDYSTNVFITRFIPPTKPSVRIHEYHPESGSVELLIAKGNINNTAKIRIERSFDRGITFKLVNELADDSFSISDYQCLVNDIMVYRVTAISPQGTETHTDVEVSTLTNPNAPTVKLGKCASYLSTGANFENVLVFPYKITRERVVTRERATFKYSGRKYPVAYVGQSVDDVFTISGLIKTGSVADGVTEAQLVEIAESPYAVFLWRDPEGHYLYCSLSEFSIERQSPSISTWSITLTRVDFVGGENVAGLQ